MAHLQIRLWQLLNNKNTIEVNKMAIILIYFKGIRALRISYTERAKAKTQDNRARDSIYWISFNPLKLNTIWRLLHLRLKLN